MKTETKISRDNQGAVTMDVGAEGLHIIHVPYFGSIHIMVYEFENYGEIHRFSDVSLHPHTSPDGETSLTIFTESLGIKKKFVEANGPEPHNFDLIVN